MSRTCSSEISTLTTQDLMLEVVADGLTLWQGTDLSNACVTSPSGWVRPQQDAHQHGAVLEKTRLRKERTHPNSQVREVGHTWWSWSRRVGGPLVRRDCAVSAGCGEGSTPVRAFDS